MQLSASRDLDASPEAVWATQLDHASWPARLPNFQRVERGAGPFAPGATAAITQPGLGTVTWTVTELEETPERREYAWTGSARGARYEGRHRVEALPGGRSRLTLGLRAEGPLIALLGWALRGAMQKAVEDEADAFVRWVAGG